MADAPFPTRSRRLVERDVLTTEKARDAAARALDFDRYQECCREIESLRAELLAFPRQRRG